MSTLPRIDKCALIDFIAALVDQDYTGKVFDPYDTPEEKIKAFESLYEQFNEAIGGKELVAQIKQLKQLAYLQNKVQRAEALLDVIIICPARGIYEQLFSFGYNLPKKEYTYENINSVVRIFVAKYKRDKTDLDRLIFEYESSHKSGKAGKSSGYTWEYFQDSVIEISTSFQVHLKINELTVSEYCGYMKKYKSHIEMLQKQQQAI